MEDLKADDMGSWKGNGTRRSYFKLNSNNMPEFRKAVPSLSNTHFVVVRRYFVHRTYNKFRRSIIEIQGLFASCYDSCYDSTLTASQTFE